MPEIRMCRLLAFLLLGSLNTAQLFGGRPAEDREFPFVVCIIGEFRCTGTLFALDKIITNAQCILIELEYKTSPSLIAVAGVVLTTDKSNKNYQARNLTFFKPYYDYRWENPYGILHDIAFVGVDRPFVKSDALGLSSVVSTEPKEFRTAWDKLVENRNVCQVISWGGVHGREKGAFPDKIVMMRVYEVIPWNDEDCKNILEETYTPDFICSSAREPKDHIVGSTGTGGILLCDGHVYGLFYVLRMLEKRVDVFLLLWHYIDYFQLGEKSASASLQCFLSLYPLFFTAFARCLFTSR